MKPLLNLPLRFQRDWGASLISALGDSAYRLVDIRATDPKGYQSQRIIVQVLDINGFPIPNVPIAFSYSTAQPYLTTEEFYWQPPTPRRADIVATNGGGMIEHIQNGGVKAGESGGVTVYPIDPNIPADAVRGMGMLADHTGVLLTFQRQVAGEVSLADRLTAVELRVAVLEKNVGG